MIIKQAVDIVASFVCQSNNDQTKHPGPIANGSQQLMQMRIILN